MSEPVRKMLAQKPRNQLNKMHFRATVFLDSLQRAAHDHRVLHINQATNCQYAQPNVLMHVAHALESAPI